MCLSLSLSLSLFVCLSPLSLCLSLSDTKVLAEISRYGNAHGDQMTLKFLTSLNKIFERGILSREHVKSDDSPVLNRIKEGYSFFTSWCEDVIKNG